MVNRTGIDLGEISLQPLRQLKGKNKIGLEEGIPREDEADLKSEEGMSRMLGAEEKGDVAMLDAEAAEVLIERVQHLTKLVKAFMGPRTPMEVRGYSTLGLVYNDFCITF